MRVREFRHTKETNQTWMVTENDNGTVTVRFCPFSSNLSWEDIDRLKAQGDLVFEKMYDTHEV